jgi:alpha-beta hydrolase superfamily lysophospholipase
LRCILALALLCAGFLPAPEVRAESLIGDVKPSEIPGKPGTIIRIWPLVGGGPGNAEAFRVLYRSTGLNGEPIAVSGAFFFPAGPAPERGRDVVAWAHPTSGVAEKCGPSLMPDVSGMIWGLENILAQGYVVAATDYPGLGSYGVHPYLIGPSEARSVLDSVRAIRNLPNTGATDRFVVWGHSQGGHAALYTGELAASYAPELKLMGVAAAAPATDLIALFDHDYASLDGKILAAMALWSWSKLYRQPIDSIIEPAAIPTYERTVQLCMESLPQFQALDRTGGPLQDVFLKADPTKTEPWRSVMLKNSPSGKIPAPVLIAQGTADTTVEPEITKRYAQGLCHRGTPVSYIALPGVSHVFAAQKSAGETLSWMIGRFNGEPAPSDCVR